jgi:hypothetical protein
MTEEKTWWIVGLTLVSIGLGVQPGTAQPATQQFSPNLVAAAQRWIGRAPAGQSCGRNEERYLRPICGYTNSNKPPVKSICDDMAKSYSAQEAQTSVAAVQVCQAPKSCKAHHTILGAAVLKFEDIPPGSCQGQTAGWSCHITITYESVCR